MASIEQDAIKHMLQGLRRSRLAANGRKGGTANSPAQRRQRAEHLRRGGGRPRRYRLARRLGESRRGRLQICIAGEWQYLKPPFNRAQREALRRLRRERARVHVVPRPRRPQEWWIRFREASHSDTEALAAVAS
jgi:hypothetical protein